MLVYEERCVHMFESVFDYLHAFPGMKERCVHVCLITCTAFPGMKMQ